MTYSHHYEVTLADDSKQRILETVRLQKAIAGSRLHFDFNVVEGVCHPMVVGRNLLTALRSHMSPEGIVKATNPVNTTGA